MIVLRRPGKWVKKFAAAVGGVAVIATGAVSALSGGSSTERPAVVSQPEMTMGSTATVEYSETIATSVAVPTDKAPPYGGSS